MTKTLSDPETKSLTAKLLAARTQFHQTQMGKTGKNTFNNSRYFQLEDFLPHALRAMETHGLLGLVSFSFEYATLTVYDIESGDTLAIQSPMSTANLKSCHDVQNLGAVESYERRYLWMTLFEVMESEVLEQIPASAPVTEMATPEQISALFDYYETDLMTDGQKLWLEKANGKITVDQAQKALDALHKLEAGQ